MLSSRMFWKLFGAYSVLTVLSAVFLIVILSKQEEQIINNRVKQRLHDSTVVLRSHMNDAFHLPADDNLQRTLRELGRLTDSRMTLVASNGTVLGDSDEDPRVMDNHRNREELLMTREQGWGLSQRTSDTLGIRMMYYALPVGPTDDPAGFVRVAVPMESVRAEIGAVRRVIWTTAGGVGLFALICTYVAVWQILRPMNPLLDAIRSMTSGNLGQEVKVSSQDEIGELARAFNRMSCELAAHVEELHDQRKELAKNSETLETILGGMVEGVVAVDPNHRVLFANQAVQRLLDSSSPPVVGRPFWETVRLPTIRDLVTEAAREDKQRRVDVELPQSNSVVSILATQLKGKPSPGVVLVVQDVTELRRLENMRKEFVSNVSHELKTPLASIQAYTEALLDGAIDDAKHNRGFLQSIEEQAERLHALILDLLRLTRIESGKDAFDIMAVPVRETVESCLRELVPLAVSKQIQLSAEPLGEPVEVMADAEGLATILNNLIENAINYTPDGGHVTVRWRTTSTEAVLEVQDSGVGIAKEHQDRVFERFYRVDKARSRALGGTGLGLSIVKHLTLEFGGRVELESEPDQGSKFCVWLPLTTVDVEPETSPAP
jgi:two-component system phosphate regulon sensor histidine kinase PhoR